MCTEGYRGSGVTSKNMTCIFKIFSRLCSPQPPPHPVKISRTLQFHSIRTYLNFLPSASSAQLKLTCLNHKICSQDLSGSVISAFMKMSVCSPVLIARACSASQNPCLMLGCMMLLICTPALSSPLHPRWDGFWRLGRGFTGRIKAVRCIAKQQRCGHPKETVQWLGLCKTFRSVSRALCNTFCLLFLYLCVAKIFVHRMEIILFLGRNGV